MLFKCLKKIFFYNYLSENTFNQTAKLMNFNNQTLNIIYHKVLKILFNLKLDNSSFKNKIFEYCVIIVVNVCSSDTNNIEKIQHFGLINQIDKFVQSDISCKYVYELIQVITLNTYYKYNLLKNSNLLLALINKFLSTQTNQVIHYLLKSMVLLISDDPYYEQTLEINYSVIEKLEDVIKFHQDEDKVDAINVIIKFFFSNKNYKLIGSNYSSNGYINPPLNSSLSPFKGNELPIYRTFASAVNILVDCLNRLNKSQSLVEVLEIIKQENLTPLSNNNITCDKRKCIDNMVTLLKKKIHITVSLARLLYKKKELQNLFMNLEGISLVFKELKSCFTETAIKDAEEYIKTLKLKSKKERPKYKPSTERKESKETKDINLKNTEESVDLKEINLINENFEMNCLNSKILLSGDSNMNPFNLFSSIFLDRNYFSGKLTICLFASFFSNNLYIMFLFIDSFEKLVSNYKLTLLLLLTFSCSDNEESRKKIIETKELNLIIHFAEDKSSYILLNLAFFFLSIGRVNSGSKKLLFELDINSILFKLVCYPDSIVQLLGISALCNYLIDTSHLEKDEIDYVIDLLNSILIDKKNSKYVFYSLYAIKNLTFSQIDNKETMKSIVKKITFEKLMEYLDEEDFAIQEQALSIFRFVLQGASTSDEIANNVQRCTKLAKRVVELIESHVKKIGVGAIITEKRINPKDDSIMTSNKITCVSNISLGIIVLMNIYLISCNSSDKYRKIVKDTGFIKTLPNLLVSDLIK